MSVYPVFELFVTLVFIDCMVLDMGRPSFNTQLLPVKNRIFFLSHHIVVKLLNCSIKMPQTCFHQRFQCAFGSKIQNNFMFLWLLRRFWGFPEQSFFAKWDEKTFCWISFDVWRLPSKKLSKCLTMIKIVIIKPHFPSSSLIKYIIKLFLLASIELISKTCKVNENETFSSQPQQSRVKKTNVRWEGVCWGVRSQKNLTSPKCFWVQTIFT